MKYINSNDNQYLYDIICTIAKTGDHGAIGYLKDNGDFVHDDFSDSMVYSWEKFLKKIRFINPDNNFDYSEYGDFFFLDNNLYVLSDNYFYSSFDIKEKLINSRYRYLLGRKKYVVKGVFAGFYIGRIDDYGKRIYYGDILRLELDNFSKCNTCKYFGGPFKDRKTKEIDVIYGPISFDKGWHHCSNPEEPFYIANQQFGVIPNLCMSINTKIIANVFFNFNSNSTSDFDLSIIYKASLPDSGKLSCSFWDYYIPKEIRESNSINENWKYAINKYKKENLLTSHKNIRANSAILERKHKNNLWSILKKLWY